MKSIYYLLIFVMFAAQILIGCKSDTNNPITGSQQEVNRIVFNGGGFNNASAQAYMTYAGYYPSMDKTGFSFYIIISPDTMYLLLYTPGQTTGTFPWMTEGDHAILYVTGHNSGHYNAEGSGTTTITSYGNVGQNIQGNFNGKVDAAIPPYDTINVSCSNFSVNRHQ